MRLEVNNMDGKIVEVKGPVVDVEFTNGLPNINDALVCKVPANENNGVEIN